MNKESVKTLLDICFEAKKIVELTPQLPEGIKPKHLYLIQAIYQLSKKKKYIMVKDISKIFRIRTPEITRMINDLVNLNVLHKNLLPADHRVMIISLTESGNKYYETFICDYHLGLGSLLQNISDEDVRTTVKTIRKVYLIMHEKQQSSIEH